MTEDKATPEASEQQFRHQRKLRNYLINMRFQLKYTLMITSLCTVLVVILGIPLYKTVSDASDQLVAQALQNPMYSSDAQVELLIKSVDQDKRKTVLILFAFLLTLLVGLTLSSIYVTHKVAGPMYKIQKLLSTVQGNNLQIEGRLRKGDELLELFQSFDDMIGRLRQYRQEEIASLTEVIDQLRQAPEKGNIKDNVSNLEKLRDKLQLSLK